MSLGQRIREVASLVPPAPRSTPPTPIASVESDWDDDVVNYPNDRTDDTVNVAVETVEAGAAVEMQGMTETQALAMESAASRAGAPKGVDGPTAVGGTKAVGHTRTGPVNNGGTPQPSVALPVMIRVAGNGAVVTNKGGSEELAGVVAYAHRLIELVGDMLGLERFMAVECSFKAMPDPAAAAAGGRATTQERCLLFAEENGDTVLVRPRAEGDLRALRETLGL